MTVPFVLMGFVALAATATPPVVQDTPPGAEQVAATRTYQERCADCHGPTLRGGKGPSILQYVRYHTNKEVVAVIQGPKHPPVALPVGEMAAVLADIRVLAGTNPTMATGGYTGQRGSGPGGRGAAAREGDAAAAAPPRLSPADGKALVSRICTGCHTVEIATMVRRTEEGWARVVEDMVARGAVGTPDEIQQVIWYLTDHYGLGGARAAAAPEPAVPTPAQAPAAAAQEPRSPDAPRGQGPGGGRGLDQPELPTGPVTIKLADGTSLTGTLLAQSDFDATLLADRTFHLLERAGTVYKKKPVEPKHDWLIYDGGYDGNRYSPLDQINRETVKRLAVAWIFPTPNSTRLEVTPVVVDGVMYITGWNEIFAVDATTGRQLWTYSEPRHPGLLSEAGDGANRGAAIGGDRVFMAMDHAHLVAFNRFTGEKLWDVEMGPHEEGYSATLAPLAIGEDLVLSGVSGGEEGARGFVDAYRADTGERVWRFYTIPARGEPGSETWIGQAIDHGCGATWLTGSYDPELDLTYWSVGNPCPDYTGDERLGDNLYTSSVVALKATTGELQWYYQFTPHDTHDWDSNQPMVLVDEMWEGRPRKLLLHGDRNGVFYVLDRTNGELLLAENLSTKVTWHKGFTKDGRPIVDPGSIATREGVAVCPGSGGGTNWPAASYNPGTRLFYTRVLDSCGVYASHHDPLGVSGNRWFGRGTPTEEARKALEVLQGDMPRQSYIRAIDPFTGRKVWEYPTLHTRAGVMSTAGGLVFLAAEGGFVALDAETGKPVWHVNLGQAASASPMSYMVGGKQYIAQAGTGLVIAYALK